MKSELFLLQPEPGKLVRISIPYHHVFFLFGFCRSILHVGRQVQFFESFRLGMDPAMTRSWAEPFDLGLQTHEGYSFEIVEEEPWMSEPRPTGRSGSIGKEGGETL